MFFKHLRSARSSSLREQRSPSTLRRSDSQATSPRAVRWAIDHEIATSKEAGKKSSFDWEEAAGAVSVDCDPTTSSDKMRKGVPINDLASMKVGSHNSSPASGGVVEQSIMSRKRPILREPPTTDAWVPPVSQWQNYRSKERSASQEQMLDSFKISFTVDPLVCPTDNQSSVAPTGSPAIHLLDEEKSQQAAWSRAGRSAGFQPHSVSKDLSLPPTLSPVQCWGVGEPPGLVPVFQTSSRSGWTSALSEKAFPRSVSPRIIRSPRPRCQSDSSTAASWKSRLFWTKDWLFQSQTNVAERFREMASDWRVSRYSIKPPFKSRSRLVRSVNEKISHVGAFLKKTMSYDQSWASSKRVVSHEEDD